MSDESPNVTFVGGKAIEQHESLDSNLEPDEREAAKAAVREAIASQAEAAGKEPAEDAKSSRAKDPFRPPGTTPERGPDGKFLPSEKSPALPNKPNQKSQD